MLAKSAYHQFEVVANYGPPQLFASLRRVCESARGKAVGADFEFEWIKRGIWITAKSAEAAAGLARELDEAVRRDVGPGQLIVGKSERISGGAWRQSIGILLQTPDVYTQVMAQALYEFGVLGVMLTADQTAIEVPLTKANQALNYQAFVMQFPLPPYLTVEDRGLVRE